MTRTPLSITSAPLYSEEKIRESMAVPKGGPVLADSGTSEYTIIYSEKSSEELIAACRYLCSILNSMIGTDSIKALPESSVSQEKGKLISVGHTGPGGQVDISEVQHDGYRLLVSGETLYIKGISDKGSKNGVYDFLESRLECMFIRNDYDYIPSFPTIHLPPYDEIINPSMAWRKQFQYEALENTWYDRLKLNGTRAKEGYKEGIYDQWGTWSHSFYDFVPPEKYYKDHPEYYALHKGKRVFEAPWGKGILSTHLCLTNEEVYRIVEEEMRRRILSEPEMKYWDFSIMDTPLKVCQCDSCRAVNEKARSGMGTLLNFLNRLAGSLGPEFPHVLFSTLAYQDCIDVPDGMTAADNVVIKLCANPGSQGFSYRTGGHKNSDKIRDLVKAWGAVAGKIVIWDYVVNFNHLLLPFPNYDVQKQNMDFYVENNIIGVFHQGSRERGDEMADMRTYLLSRQMWNKDIDLESLMMKYLQINYGQAYPLIAEYLETMSRSYIMKKKELNLYDSPYRHRRDYLSNKNIRKYLYLTEKSLECTAGMEREQVEKVRMNVLYAKIMETSLDYKGKEKACEELKIYTAKYGVEKYHEIRDISIFYSRIVKQIIRRDKMLFFSLILPGIGPFILLFSAVRNLINPREVQEDGAVFGYSGFSETDRDFEESELYIHAVHDPEASGLARPSVEQIRYHEQERTSFVTLDPCTWQGREYDDHSTDPAEMKLDKINVHQWMDAAESWGSKEIMFVAKHTGGFCWWPTETGTYNVSQIAWKDGRGDLVADVAEACRTRGLNMGVYIYPGDDFWGAPIGSGGKTDNPDDQDRYSEILRRQYNEVFQRCADVTIELYFDGNCIVDLEDVITKWVGGRALRMQGPGATLRWVGTEEGYAPYPAWNTVKSTDLLTGVATAVQDDPDGGAWASLQCNTTLYDHYWFWSKRNERKRKSLKKLILCYYRSVGRGMTFLLNSSPDISGLIPEKDMALYARLGEELKRRFDTPLGIVRGVGQEHIIRFEKPQRVNQFMIMEDYRYGHRIRSYRVSIQTAKGKWMEVNRGSSVGRKRIVVFKPRRALAVRLTVEESIGTALIRSFMVYNISGNNRYFYDGRKEVKDLYSHKSDEQWERPELVSSVHDKGKSLFRFDLRGSITSPGQYYVKLNRLEPSAQVEKILLYYNETNISDGKFLELREKELYLINRHAQVTEESEVTLVIEMTSDSLPEPGHEVLIRKAF